MQVLKKFVINTCSDQTFHSFNDILQNACDHNIFCERKAGTYMLRMDIKALKWGFRNTYYCDSNSNSLFWVPFILYYKHILPWQTRTNVTL